MLRLTAHSLFKAPIFKAPSIVGATVLGLFFGLAQARAQTCAAGSTLLKNDAHPAVPSGPFAVAIVPGLCQNEAAMCIFNISGPVTINSVAVMFGQAQGTSGVKAVIDVEIYDGVTTNANGTYTLGPQVFKLSQGGSNAQIATHGINTIQLPTPVRVSAKRFVVGFRMIQNLATGTCLAGYKSNFATDATNTCTPGKNILDAINHGPVDPATYQGFGVPLCPLFFRGDWMIRACVTPEIATTWTGTATPGGVLSLSLQAPGHGFEQYLMIASGGISTGTITPWGKLPLDNDVLFQCFFGACRSAMFINDYGVLDGSGKGFAIMKIPNHPSLINSGLTIYTSFITSASPSMLPWTAVSAPSRPIIIN